MFLLSALSAESKKETNPLRSLRLSGDYILSNYNTIPNLRIRVLRLMTFREMEQKISLLRIFKAGFGKFVVDGNGILSVKAGKTEIFPGDVRRLYQVIDI